MKKRFMLILLVLIVAAMVYFLSMRPSQEAAQVQNAMLVKVVDDCASIADNAVANMQAIVEFQTLEIEGRKFNVMRHCMDDRDFIENPQWLAYGTPLAKAKAAQKNISQDEAIEDLRRSQMMSVKVIANQPIYWQRRHD